MEFLKFASTIGNLKKIERTGWVKNNLPNPESVADHIFRVAVMAMVLAPKLKVDQNKVVKMALVHDLAESTVGDLVLDGKYANVSPEEKAQKEAAALNELLSLIDSSEEYQQLFVKYEAGNTPEAKFVRNIDRLEMLLQAAEYEKEFSTVDLSNHFETTIPKIVDPKLQSLLQQIIKMRSSK